MLSRVDFNNNDKVLVWYNIEFLVYLVKEIGLSPKNIYIYTNTQDKLILEKQGYNVVYQENIDFDEIKNEFLDMKFDIVLGNPPFQKNLDSGHKSVDNPWAKFIYLSSNLIKDNGYVVMISPDGWCSPTYDIQKGNLSIFRDVFKNNNLIYVAFDDIVKPYFQKGTSFSYFLFQKSKYSGTTIFETLGEKFEIDITNLFFIPKNINSISFSIHNKLLNTNFKFSFERYRKKDGGMLDENHPHFYIPKIKFSRGLAKFEVNGDNGNSGYDVFTYSYLLQNNENLDSALSVLNSKLYRFVLNQKWNQYFTKYIPNSVHKPNLDKIYTDEEIYEIFNLTQDEINFIESNVK
jgi:site-specific DNA-methyltransferase (adenine-specific)